MKINLRPRIKTYNSQTSRLGLMAAFLLLVVGSVMAQEKVVTRTRVVAKPSGRFTSDKITAFVDGHQTKIEVLSLFKPEEITMKSERPATESMERLTMQITVKDKSHPVLRYFRNQARLYYKGKYYDHNVLPDIKTNQVMKVEYQAYDDPATPGKADDYLEVHLYGEEYMPHEPTKFRSERRRIRFYDIDGQIVETENISRFKLKAGEFTSEILYGKEAAERYHNARYAEGIEVIRTKPKK